MLSLHQRLEKLEDRARCLSAAKSSIAAQNLPDVDVAQCHELGEAPLSRHAMQRRQRRRKNPLAPFGMLLPGTLYDGMQRGAAPFLGEESQHSITKFLVMLDEDGHRARDISRRRRPALPADALGAAHDGGSEDALFAAEAPDDGENRDACPLGDLIERYLISRPLPENRRGGVEDAFGRVCRRLGAAAHAILAARRLCFHVSGDIINMAAAQERLADN